MIEVETFTYIFRQLDNNDRLIVGQYLQGIPIESIAKKCNCSKQFIFKRIHLFYLMLQKYDYDILDNQKG